VGGCLFGRDWREFCRRELGRRERRRCIFGGEDEEVVSVQIQAVNFVRENLDLPVTQVEDGEHGCLGKKMFMGHGIGDKKVDVRLREEAVGTLRVLEIDVQWRTYDVGHWYKAPDELDDNVTFLSHNEGVSVDTDCHPSSIAPSHTVRTALVNITKALTFATPSLEPSLNRTIHNVTNSPPDINRGL
jgi:hypothetical protein